MLAVCVLYIGWCTLFEGHICILRAVLADNQLLQDGKGGRLWFKPDIHRIYLSDMVEVYNSRPCGPVCVGPTYYQMLSDSLDNSL